MGIIGVVAMNSARLRRILANLLRVVPEPPKPVARPTGSFAGLKVGQLLRPKPGVAVLTNKVPPGENDGTDTWAVFATDSQGADLYLVQSPDTKTRVESRDWKSSWSRVRAPRKPRKHPADCLCDEHAPKFTADFPDAVAKKEGTK